MMTMRAPAPSAQAISTSCCSGIESERTSASGEMSAPMRWSSSAARMRRLGQFTRRAAATGSSRRPMFSATVRSGNKRGLLVNAGDAEFVRRGGREVAHALAVDFNGAAVGLVRAGDDLDERGFARAVFAEQRVNFPRPQIKRHALQAPAPRRRIWRRP